MQIADRSDALVFFGATGDLAFKKIFPALHAMAKRGKLDVAGDRRGASGLDARSARSSTRRRASSSTASLDDAAFAALAAKLRYVDGDYNERGNLSGAGERTVRRQRVLLHYLAIPPAMFAVVIEATWPMPDASTNARIIVEKPFGRDLKSARALNETLHQGLR